MGDVRLDKDRSGVAIITLARPEVGNAMNWSLIDDFSTACLTIAGDDGVRAVLIEGEGKNFCVGGDIRQFAAEPDPAAYIKRLADRLHVGIEVLGHVAAPVIVAVQGGAAGAGLSLAAGADLVVGAASSSFSMAYAGIGLVADGGATFYLPRVIGLRLTQELAYAGRRLSAGEALACGLVTRLVEDQALRAEARALAERVAAGPTFAFGQMKRLLADTYRTGLRNQIDAESAAIAAAMSTRDARDAIAAFLDRTPASFVGR